MSGLAQFQRAVEGWPAPFGGVGKRIADCEATLGHMRHDVLVPKSACGLLIGPSGKTFKMITDNSGCNIFIVDKEPPPGHHPDQRVVVLVGMEDKIILAAAEISKILAEKAGGGGGGAAPAAFGSVPAVQAAPQDPNSPFKRLVGDWPPPYGGTGKRIATALSVPGAVRHDILVEQGSIGKIIGASGQMHKELTAKTSCNIFIIDKEIPPGVPPDQRLVCLVGTEAQVAHAAMEVMTILQALVEKLMKQQAGGGVFDQGFAGGLAPLQQPQQPQIRFYDPTTGQVLGPAPGAGGGLFYDPTTGQMVSQQQQFYDPATGQIVTAAAPQPQATMPGIQQQLLPEFHRLSPEWPKPYGGVGAKIQQSMTVPGRVRHDMLVDKVMVGRIIGSGGKQHRELTAKTGCDVFVVDKEAPPNCAPDQRLVSLVGSPYAVSAAAIEVNTIVSSFEAKDLGVTGSASALFGQTAIGAAPPPSVEMMSDFQRLVPDDWPQELTENFAKRCQNAVNVPGNIRHDMFIDSGMVGYIIGSRGAQIRELTQTTSCQIFLYDKLPPPGGDASTRLLSLIGTPLQVSHANMEVARVIQSSAEKRAVDAGKRSAPDSGFGGATGGAEQTMKRCCAEVPFQY